MASTPVEPVAPPRRGLAIASLAIGLLSLPTFGCLVIGAIVGILLGIMALARENKSPREYGGRGLAIGGIVASALSLILAIPLAGIVAAIAIPSMLRARVSANESVAIRDVGNVLVAQNAYHPENCASYGRLECLSDAKAAGCSTLARPAGPFLPPGFATPAERSGYRRTFHAGPEVSLTPGPRCGGGSGIEWFAYTAEPMVRNQTGVRAFCVDVTGVVCVRNDGVAPPLVEGRCTECNPLR